MFIAIDQRVCTRLEIVLQLQVVSLRRDVCKSALQLERMNDVKTFLQISVHNSNKEPFPLRKCCFRFKKYTALYR